MKRSEMVANIANFIFDNNENYTDQLTAAEGLLKFIENNGMLPPRNKKPYNYHVHNNGPDYVDDLHDWDEE